MNKIILTKQKNYFESKIYSEKSVININTISLILDVKSNESWVEIVSKIKIEAILFYPVYIDLKKGINDVREITIPIDLKINPFQKNPIFHLNQKIRNEAFKLGWNTELKHYKTFKIIFQNAQDFDYSIEIDLEIH